MAMNAIHLVYHGSVSSPQNVPFSPLHILKLRLLCLNNYQFGFLCWQMTHFHILSFFRAPSFHLTRGFWHCASLKAIKFVMLKGGKTNPPFLSTYPFNHWVSYTVLNAIQGIMWWKFRSFVWWHRPYSIYNQREFGRVITEQATMKQARTALSYPTQAMCDEISKYLRCKM